MNDNKQRKVIAAVTGWTDIKIEWIGCVGCDYEDLTGIDPATGKYCQLPDYLNDLNACHEMEKTGIRCSQRGSYFTWLRRICDRDKLGHDEIQATAAQRAEAFLRTIGKWI